MKKSILLFFTLFISWFNYSQENSYAIAENYLRNGEFEKATQLYEGLYRQSPYNTTYLKQLVFCYQETNKFETADTLLKTQLKNFPNQSYLNVLIGHNYERQQKSELAEQYYQKAIDAIQVKNRYGNLTATFFKNYTKLDYAAKTYTIIMENNPRANYGFQLAQIYGEQGDFKKMFRSYIDLVDKNEDYLGNIKRYASKYITEDPDNEYNILFKQALLKKSISKPKNCWNDLLGWLFINQREYSKALVQYRALLARDIDNLGKIKSLGSIAFENKDYDTARKCCDIMIEKSNYPRDKFQAIEMNLRMDINTKQPNIESKFQTLFTTYGTNKQTLNIQLAYANYLTFTKNNPEQAIAVMEKASTFADSKFTKALLKLKLGEILIYNQQFNKALLNFSQVQTQFKNHFLGQEARFKVAQLSYFKNDFDWAKAQLKILKGSATQLIANDAAELFLTISDNQPQDSTGTGLKQYAKADLFSYQNKNTQAITLLSDIIKNYKNQPIEDEALYKQAELYIKHKEYQKAVSNLEKVIAINPEGILVDDSLFHLAELYRVELNNPKIAAEYYQKIIFAHASSIYLVDARKKYRKLRGDDI